MDTGFMSEGAEASDGIVERDVDFYGLGNEILDIFQFVELVFRSNIFSVNGDHTCHKAAQRRDAIAFLREFSSI